MKKLLTIIMTTLILFTASGSQAGTELTPTIITPGITYPGDEFGIIVDMADNVAIVGTLSENGKAFVFENENNVWTEKAVLTPSNGNMYLFGEHVAVSDNFAVVSGKYEGGYESVYIYQKAENGWADMNETQILSIYQPEYEEVYVTDLAIHSGTLVVCWQISVQGVNLNPVQIYNYKENQWILSKTIVLPEYRNFADIYEDRVIIGSHHSGALVYRKDANGKWEEEVRLFADDMESTEFFGRDVAITDGFAIVGDNGTSSAYIFEYDGINWIQKQKLTESDPYGEAAYYGLSLDITEKYALVGSLGYKENFDLLFCGAAFLYKRNENNIFEKVDKFLAPIPQYFGTFGRSVALSEDHMIIGHPEDHTSAPEGSAVIFNLYSLGDIDRDGDVDKCDLAILKTYLNHSASECPECDHDGDGMITIQDARKQVLQPCTYPNCECR